MHCMPSARRPTFPQCLLATDRFHLRLLLRAWVHPQPAAASGRRVCGPLHVHKASDLTSCVVTAVLQEISILKSISYDRNIVQFYGAVLTERPMLVLEYMEVQDFIRICKFLRHETTGLPTGVCVGLMCVCWVPAAVLLPSAIIQDAQEHRGAL
jgi:hypothetical protein